MGRRGGRRGAARPLPVRGRAHARRARRRRRGPVGIGPRRRAARGRADRGRPRRHPRRARRRRAARGRGRGGAGYEGTTMMHGRPPTELDTPPREFELRYYAELLWRRRVLLATAALGGLA